MVSRNRDGQGATLTIFRSRESRCEPLTATEVADALDCPRRVATDRLEQLVDVGALETKQVGTEERVWWCSDAEPSSATAAHGNEGGVSTDHRSTGDRSAIVLVDDGDDVAWVGGSIADLFDVDRADAIGRERAEFVRAALEAEVRDAAVVDEILTAPRETTSSEEPVAFELDGGERAQSVRLEYASEPIDSGRYAGGRVERFREGSRRSAPSAAGGEREALFRSLVDATEEYAIFTLDPDGHVISWNAGAERIKGYEESEVLGRHFSTFYTDEEAAAGVPAENLSRALEEGSAEDEGWRIRADGSRFWATVTITPIRDDDGELRGFAKVTRDMTDRREREQRLQREQNLLEQTLEATPVGIGVVSRDGEFVRANERARERLTAASDDRDDTLGSVEMYDETGAPVPSEERPYARVFETGEAVSDWHCQIDLPDHGRRWVSLSAVPLTDDDGEVEEVVVCSDDVTQLKEQAARLGADRDRELERYETLFEGSQDVNAIIDPDGTYSYLTPSTERVLGYDPGELVGENAFDYVHPDDRDEIWDVFRGVVEDPEFSPLVELRFRHADGSWVVLEARARNFLDDPDVDGIVAYTRDATDRKLFEDTLQALHESSRELIRSQDKTAVSRAVIEAATSVLDLPGVVVYRYDDEADALTLDENSVEAEFMREALPEFPVDHSSIVGHTYCDGEANYYADVLESDHLMADRNEVDTTAGLFVPLGDHGVLAVGWKDEDACDDRTRQLIEILAANAEAAYARVERERDLEESRRRYSTLVDNFPNGGVAMVDREMEFVTVGGETIAAPDATAAALEGSHVAENLPPELAEVFVPNYKAALEGETTTVERKFDDGIYRLHFVPVRDDDGDVFAAIGVSQDVTDRVEYERELEARARQQEVVADLGQRALGTNDLDDLFEEAVDLATDTLDSEYCTVFDLDREAEDLLLRAGVGFPEERIGSATVDVGRESQAGYTLLADEPIVVENMAEEDRFEGPNSLAGEDVESGISAVIGSRASPWGVLATHDTARRDFSEDDALFVQSVANILATAIDRRNNELELEEQREHLAALDNLNGVVRDINEALVEQTTREEIERTVCDRLAESDSYQFAWIAEVDPRTESLEPRVEAGVDGYLDAVDVGIDEDCPDGLGPAGRAARSREIHVTHDPLSDPTFEPWRDVAEEHGYRSCAAIPIVQQETLYGILGVYTDRLGAFADEEKQVVAQLGEIIGHAIAGIERKQALMSDDIVEIDVRTENVLAEAGLDGSMEGRIAFTETVSLGNDTFLQYGTATGGGVETMESLVDLFPHWEAVTVIADETVETRFELKLSEPPVVSAVAGDGGYIDEAIIENGTMHMTIHLPPTVDVRRMVDSIQETYSSAELVTRQQVSRTDAQEGVQQTLTQELTDRQRAALEASFHAGFFDWPRESSGEEVAESLDVSAPTFHQHLRKAQRKLLATILS